MYFFYEFNIKISVCIFIFIYFSFAIVFCSIIQKASNALEVLKEVLDAVDAQHPQVSLESFSYRICKQLDSGFY